MEDCLREEVQVMKPAQLVFAEKLTKCNYQSNIENKPSLPVVLPYITPEMVKKARYELNETETSKINAMEELKRLIKGEKHLLCRMDEIFLMSFLRARKFRVKQAFSLLQNYYAFRKEYSHIFDHADREPIQDLIHRDVLGLHRYRDKEGCTVLVAKVGMWDPAVDSFEDVFRALTGSFVYAAEFPATQICGYRVILDARELSWTQLKFCTPSNICLMIRSTQHCFPGRFKGIHILTENKLFNLAWSIAYPFLTKKLKSRVIFHKGGNVAELRDHISADALPKEFGGNGDEFFTNVSWSLKELDDIGDILDSMLPYGYKDKK